MTENKQIFEEFAEKKVGDLVKEHEALLNHYHKIGWALEEMSRDKKMTHAAWIRVIRGLNQSDKKAELQEPVNYQHPVEQAMVKNLRNQRAIAVQMMMKSEDMILQVKKEMAAAQKVAMEKQKLDQEAGLLQIEPILEDIKKEELKNE